MKTSKKLFPLPIGACLVIAMAFLTGSASAQSQFLLSYSFTASAASYNGNLGYSFTTGSSPLTVDDLGVLGSTASGLTESHEVGIWQVEPSGPDLLVGSATVGAAGTNTGPDDVIGTASGGSFGSGSNSVSEYYEAVSTPFTLAADSKFIISAFYNTGADSDIANLSSDYSPVFDASLATIENRYYSVGAGSFGEPTSSDTGTYIVGPDFIATVSSSTSEVPEPSTYALLGAGLLLLFLNCRRLCSRQP